VGRRAAGDERDGWRPAFTTLPSGDDILGVPLPAGARASIDLALDFAVDIPSGTGWATREFAYQTASWRWRTSIPMAVYDTDWRLETPSSQGDVIYHDASLYDVTFIAPAGLKMVATGATMERKELGDGRTAWRLAGGPMRDFNIVASPDYERSSRQVAGVEVNSYLPQDEAGERRRWVSRPTP
jgi:hypothetical protein